MVVCSVCKSLSTEGDFCEVCGSPLVADNVASSKGSSKSFGGSDKIKSGLGKENVIYKVPNIPSGYEKNIVIDNGEVVFIDDGTGMQMMETTFNTTRSSFKCYYVKKDISINIDPEIPLETKVKKIEKATLNVKLKYDINVSVSDIKLFFNSLNAMKDDTWKFSDLENTVKDIVLKALNEKIKTFIDEDGGLNLKEQKKQLTEYNDKLKEIIKPELEKYSLDTSKFLISSIDIDKMELNKLLVNNLYNK